MNISFSIFFGLVASSIRNHGAKNSKAMFRQHECAFEIKSH